MYPQVVWPSLSLGRFGDMRWHTNATASFHGESCFYRVYNWHGMGFLWAPLWPVQFILTGEPLWMTNHYGRQTVNAYFHFKVILHFQHTLLLRSWTLYRQWWVTEIKWADRWSSDPNMTFTMRVLKRIKWLSAHLRMKYNIPYDCVCIQLYYLLFRLVS